MGASLAVHALIGGVIAAFDYVPVSEFEFQVPSEVEFGLTEATEAEALPAPVQAEEPPPEQAAAPSENGTGPSAMDAGVAYADAGVPSDAPRRPRRDAAREPDGGIPSEFEDENSTSPVAFLPPGGQIALRLDLDRVRQSPVRPDVERLLGALPDWQAILGTSGIDPLRDLSRVLIATPNLRRDTLVIAGRLTPEVGDPRAILTQVVEASGGDATWETVYGVETTNWPNPDATPRRIALLGPHHFAIARNQDLPRVLAFAAARARGAGGVSNAADALLSLPDGTVLSVEIEGARRYARNSPCEMPTSLRATLEEVGDHIHLSVRGPFETPEEAATAAACFARVRDSYRGNIGVSMYLSSNGLGGVLARIGVSAEESTLAIDADLTLNHIRALVRLGAGFFEPRPTRPPAPTEVVVPPAPPPPPPPPPPN